MRARSRTATSRRAPAARAISSRSRSPSRRKAARSSMRFISSSRAVPKCWSHYRSVLNVDLNRRRTAELREEFGREPPCDFTHRARAAEPCEIGDLQVRKSAGIDALEGFEIHRDVEREALIARPPADAKAEASEFARLDVHARRVAP